MQRDGGRIVGVVGAFLDIHGERRLLDQLRKNADRMALAEDVAGFGVWHLDLPSNKMSLSPVDIDDERRRLQDLADESARLSLAEEAGGVGMWDVNLENGIVTYSAGGAALRRLPAAQVTMSAAAIEKIVPPDDLEAFHAARDRARAGARFSCEYRVVWPDGSVHWMRSRAHPVTVDGRIVEMIGSSVDIDKERRMLDELRV